MPFAVVTNVRLEGRDATEGQKYLSDVLIPGLKQRPGFQNARFLRSLDGQTGLGAVVFDTEANASASLDATATDRPAGGPPVQNTTIYEVVVEV